MGDARLEAMLKAMRRADGRGLKESAHACGVSVSAVRRNSGISGI